MKTIKGRGFLWMVDIVCVLCSGSSGLSLWGKKAMLTEPHCREAPYWQLAEGCSVPALEELSVCVALSQKFTSPQWTAFAYKQQGGAQVELGLGGATGELLAWLFGEEWSAPIALPLLDWHTVCLTWSGRSRELRLYVNGSVILNTRVNETTPGQPCCLAPNGTLTLGASHGFINRDIAMEMGSNFLGEVSMFRMWGREREPQQLANFSCPEGDVIRWDGRDWDTHGCPPQLDSNLQCAWSLYEIQMKVCIIRQDGNSTHVNSAEDILIATLPGNMSVLTIFVSASTSELHFRNHSLGMRNLAEDQAEVSKLLSTQYNNDTLILSTEPGSIRVNPVGRSHGFCIDRPSLCYLANRSLLRHRSHYLLRARQYMDGQADKPRGPAHGHSTPFCSPGNTTTASDPVSNTPTNPMVSALTDPPSVTLPTVASSAIAATTSSGPDNTWTDKRTSPGSDQHTSTETIEAHPPLNGTEGSETIYNPSDTFYGVVLNVTMNGSSQDPAETIQTWLRDTLEGEQMFILNFALRAEAHSQLSPGFEQSTPKMNKTSALMKTSHGCSFHVRVTASPFNVTGTEKQICDLLSQTYTNGSVSVKADPKEIHITHIEPGQCPEQVELTEWGLYSWPQTEAQHLASLPCDGERMEEATRLCEVGEKTGKARWSPSNLQLCPPVEVTISDLDKINITANNSADMVEIIGALVGNATLLPLPQLQLVLDRLMQVVKVCLLTSSLATDILNIIANILQRGTDLPSVANEILIITDDIGDKMSFPGHCHNITAPSLALSLINVNPSQFDGLTFGVSSFSQGLEPKIFINEEFLDDGVAFISLPQEVEKFFPQDGESQPRIQFHFYGTPDLFQDPENVMDLYTYVVSASITNAIADIRDLEHPVRVTLHHRTPNLHKDSVQCVYWDFQRNGGRGGWDTAGCKRHSTRANHTTCLCDHLTHFAVLLDISRSSIGERDRQILSMISHVGCGLSCVFLGISLLTYTAFKKLRRDYPSRILINLSLALMGLNLVFLLNSWLSSHDDRLCIAVAATLHYFTLASFTWMGLEAVHMYLALVKVFNIYVPSYIFKFCILGWGVPLVIVSIVLAVQKDAYGSALYSDALEPSTNSEHFCWLQEDVVFYVSVVTYILLILICNISVFGLVLVQIRKMQVNKPAGSHRGPLTDLRGAASLTFLLGLTWILGFFSWGPARVPLIYLFSILNSLQGFFLFLFHCLLKENVRKQWRVHLCCGHFRLIEYSDWSRSMTVVGRSKRNQMGHRPSVKSDDSNDTRRTSSSSHSGLRQAGNFRSSLDLVYEDAVVHPRASTDGE
ncbi:hypothetical protein AAFF_G00288700 [Aldrovandia affinis]|uniref:Adhesion G-protein coupled receptor G4 n=1 Tax=Aldrovandia affinis TaxID=143900 RepID=A0AAD7SQW4_9TELE|nr:hypothetical protein AAFF_G00288700 [Aldrovandia affinis]